MQPRRVVRRPNTALRRDPLEWLRLEIESLPDRSEDRETVLSIAREILAEIAAERAAAEALTLRLAESSAETAELVVELDLRNEALDDANQQLGLANVHAAEMVAELEVQAQQIERLNGALGNANATASELVAELDVRREELENVNEKLRTTNEERSRLLGVVAHDLRAGIGGMQGLATLLTDSLDGAVAPETEAVGHAALIAAEARRLLQLLGSLLDVSRIEHSRLELARERTQLSHLARQAVRFHRPMAETKDQTIELRGDEATTDTLADPVRARQVLDNLLSNAVKYSPPQCRITVQLWQRDGEVGVDVLDEGPGFSDDDLARLFTSFQSLSAKPTGGEDSFGLGMVIARRIADLHGGRLVAANRENHCGARMRFVLPLVEPPNVKRRVLLAEDNKVLRFLLVSQLEKLNQEVVVAENGAEAIEAWSQHCFDLIFMDLRMPGVDGLEAIRIIRARETDGRRTPIVALTSHTDTARHQEALDMGADDSECKPVTGPRLQNLIETWTVEQ